MPSIDTLSVEEQDAIKSLLSGLFPRLGSAYGGSGYGSDWLSPWAKAKRICSPEYCPRYFSYSVPKSDVRDSQIDDLYVKAATGTPDKVSQMVAAFFTCGKARRVIERLRQGEESISPESVPSLAVAVAANAKHIPNPPSPFSFAEPVSQAGILISHLIKRLPVGANRVALAKEVIQAADPLWFGSEVLRWLHVTNDEDKADSNTLTKDELKEVAKTLIERIKASAKAGTALFNVDVSQEQSLLYEWRWVEGRQPVQAHLSSVFEKNPINVGLFLRAMAPRAWGQEDVLPQAGELDGDQLKNIKLIYDLDALAELIRSHLPGDFENPQRFPDENKPIEQRLAEQFMYVYNKWKKDGEPPDRPVAGDTKLQANEAEEETDQEHEA